MDKALKVLLAKPLMATSPEKRETAMDLIASMVNSGKTVVLGGDRCGICGSPLGSPVPDATARMGSRPTKLFMRLCTSCYDLAKYGGH